MAPSPSQKRLEIISNRSAWVCSIERCARFASRGKCLRARQQQLSSKIGVLSKRGYGSWNCVPTQTRHQAPRKPTAARSINSSYFLKLSCWNSCSMATTIKRNYRALEQRQRRRWQQRRRRQQQRSCGIEVREDDDSNAPTALKHATTTATTTTTSTTLRKRSTRRRSRFPSTCVKGIQIHDWKKNQNKISELLI